MRIQYISGLTPVHFATGLLLGGLCLCPAHGQASFQGLGDLPGGIYESGARSVSADGLVVIGSGHGDTNWREAFRWTSGGGMIGLGDLTGSFPTSIATGLSADGSVVVGTSRSAASHPETEAYRWTNGGGMVGLGGLSGDIFSSRASGISANGLVVVGSSTSLLGLQGYRWTSEGGMVGLGDLPGSSGDFPFGDFYSDAHAVSADGSVVVGLSLSALGLEAFRWTSESGMVGLGDLEGDSFQSDALDVSTDGSVVVGWGTSALSTRFSEAFRWTSEAGMIGLGDLPGGVFASRANGVSADGSVVVGAGSSTTGPEAFIWDDSNGMQSLQAVLEGQLGLDLAGWTLISAGGVSTDGTAIVGVGINPDGFDEAFIAVIPGPGVCPGDIIGLDGNVNVTDLLSLLGGWGPNPGHPADINDDGNVNVTDLLVILGAWGACP